MKLRHLLLVALSSLALSHGAGAQPVPGGRANLIVQPEPPSLMLGLVTNAPTQLVAGQIYEGTTASPSPRPTSCSRPRTS